MVPSWAKNGANLLSNKLRYLVSILILTTEPAKMVKMLEWMNYQNRTKFRESYVDPLRQAGFLSLTIPNNPNDPENKYVITESGKAFLAGL